MKIITNENIHSLEKPVDLRTHDEAFLNSILSYGIYTSREWTLADPSLKDEEYFMKLLNNSKVDILDVSLKQVYELYLSVYSRQTFEPVRLNIAQEGDYCSYRYGYNTKFKVEGSKYEALDNLAKAGVFRTKNEDGTYNLHLSFRGTDTEARAFKDFLSKAYLDMSAYYDAFKPLEMAVLDYAQDPANKIKEVHVSGHSLGGSMVQEFFDSPEVKKSGLQLKGFTYGAPGSTKHKLYSFLPAVYHGVKHKKFLELGRSALSLLMIGPHAAKDIDNRITQYTHSGDLIPKVSMAAYEKTGQHVHLEDNTIENGKENFILTGKHEDNCLDHLKSKKGNFFMKAMIATQHYLFHKPIASLKRSFTFQSHDMLRYVLNIDSMMREKTYDMQEARPHLMPHLHKFTSYRQRFEKVTFNAEQDPISQHLMEKTIPLKTTLPESMQTIINMRKKAKTMLMIKKISNDLLGKPLDISIVSAQTGNPILKL